MTGSLLIALLLVAIATCACVIWAAIELIKTLRSTRTLADDIDASLIPLLGKADVTVDALNAELLRIDEIVTRVEEVTDRIGSISRTVQDVTNAPAGIAERVRKAFGARRQSHATAAERTATDAGSPAESAELMIHHDPEDPCHTT